MYESIIAFFRSPVPHIRDYADNLLQWWNRWAYSFLLQVFFPSWCLFRQVFPVVSQPVQSRRGRGSLDRIEARYRAHHADPYWLVCTFGFTVGADIPPCLLCPPVCYIILYPMVWHRFTPLMCILLIQYMSYSVLICYFQWVWIDYISVDHGVISAQLSRFSALFIIDLILTKLNNPYVLNSSRRKPCTILVITANLVITLQ